MGRHNFVENFEAKFLEFFQDFLESFFVVDGGSGYLSD